MMRIITKELILGFKEYLMEEEKSKNTIEKYIRDITFFKKWLCFRETTKLLVLDYKKELCIKYAPASVNAEQSIIINFILRYNNKTDIDCNNVIGQIYMFIFVQY